MKIITAMLWECNLKHQWWNYQSISIATCCKENKQNLNVEVVLGKEIKRKKKRKSYRWCISTSGKSSFRSLMCVTLFAGPCSTSFTLFNSVYCVKLVKFIFILDSFAFVPQPFVISTNTFINKYFPTIWEVK